MCKKTTGKAFKVALTYLYQNLFNIKKNLALVLTKIVYVVFCVFSTNLNEAVNIFCTLPEWIRKIQMIQCFSTIKTWMKILHG